MYSKTYPDESYGLIPHDFFFLKLSSLHIHSKYCVWECLTDKCVQFLSSIPSIC